VLKSSLDVFLKSSDVIDWQAESILELARQVRGRFTTDADIAQAAFEWVRDEIKHTADFALPAVTCSASEVLRHGTGLCYAKSHLLAALLRANQIPAGMCYQRLSMDGVGPPFCLHGLNAVYLSDCGWYRIDARGNKPGVATQFAPPREFLAFETSVPGEQTFTEIWLEPLACVVESLRRYQTCDELCRHLPDWTP
jgi:transglutaminase-like putative cysteine protease